VASCSSGHYWNERVREIEKEMKEERTKERKKERKKVTLEIRSRVVGGFRFCNKDRE